MANCHRFAGHFGMEPGYWRDLLRPVFAGRKVIITGTPLAGATEQVKSLRDLGAADVFVLADGTGTGEIADAPHFILDLTSSDLMSLIRAGQAALRTPPREAVAAIDAFDPDRDALVVGSFLNEVATLAGRRCLSYRRPEWLAIEDKVAVDDVFDAAGVRRAPHRTVPVRDLTWSGADEVWAGDASNGFNGGAERTHRVRTAADAVTAREALGRDCSTARVMPFLDGIPCSVHGVVFRDDIVVLRPVEMIVLRRDAPPYFFYAGAASYWDPPDTDRDYMRATARRVGEEIRRRASFLGAFTLDGVLTAGGFLPTEINARSGAGLGVISRGAEDIPLHFLLSAISGGVELDYRPRELEGVLLEAADAKRGGGTWRAVPDVVASQRAQPLAWRDQWNRADDGDADAWFDAGPSELGGFVRLTLNAGRTPAGPSVAPKAAAFYEFCDRNLGTHVGPLGAAPDVRA